MDTKIAVGVSVFWIEANDSVVSFYCVSPLAEFAIGDSQIVKSLRKVGVQPSGFKILVYGLSEPGLRR